MTDLSPFLEKKTIKLSLWKNSSTFFGFIITKLFFSSLFIYCSVPFDGDLFIPSNRHIIKPTVYLLAKVEHIHTRAQ